MINKRTPYISFMNTPPLWTGRTLGVQQFAFPALDFPDFEPAPIPAKLRLGHQMEYCFRELVDYSDAYDIVLHNLPIRDGSKTLGEIDFLLTDKQNDRLLQVELTYKFYLVYPNILEPIHQLIGPNKRDTFFAKLEKVKHRQFPLLHMAAGAQALAAHGIDHQEVEHQCCFKAQLFLPFGRETSLLEGLNTACVAGYWLHLADFTTAAFAEDKFYIPTKTDWVIAPHEQVVWVSHTAVIADIEERLARERVPMLWCRTVEGRMEKLFVLGE